MIAVDTNVVVRFLMNDEPSQARRARALFERAAGSPGEPILIPSTVLLETEWVLRSGYGVAKPAAIAGIRSILGLPGVTTRAPRSVARAVDVWEAGLDFADALHLLLSGGDSAGLDFPVFFTFDARLRTRAGRWLPEAPTGAP